MIVDLALSDTCPIFKTGNERYLHRLLDRILQGWHILASPDPVRLQQLLSVETWRIYGIFLTSSYKGATTSFRTLAHPADCASCDVDSLSLFLNLPTVLLVENAKSDGDFIKAVANRLKPRLNGSLRGAYQSVQIYQGGGIGELPREITRISERYILHRPNGLPPRFLVVADSDAKQPGQPSGDASLVAKAARTTSIDCHILEKRSIENYIPDEALAGFARKRPHLRDAVTAITSLSGAARDHYPVKGGLPGDISKSTEIESLYPTGFPRELGLSNFVTDFLNVSRDNLTKNNLVERDSGGDLKRLLGMLERNI
jgi:hypothetical protein